MLKTCPKCSQSKPILSDFNEKSGTFDGLQSWCKQCCSAGQKDWAKRTRYGTRKYPRHANFLKNAKASAARCRPHLKRFYGITGDQFDAILKSQNGLCPICKTSNPVRWHLDHDHKTNRIRGVLCGKCNVAIGMMGDDPVIIHAALEYLQK